jgi:hypothetical protein
MQIDTDQLFHRINSDLADCQNHLDGGMFPQVNEEVREERSMLRDLKTWLIRLERYADNPGLPVRGLILVSERSPASGDCEHG